MMKRQSRLTLLLILIFFLLLNGQTPILAQDKTLFWHRYDVTLNVQTNSDILIEEIQEIEFTGGAFRFGFAAIPLDRAEDITDISVSELIDGAEQPYTPDSTGDYGFIAAVNEGNLEITWYFPPTRNSRHTYILRYRVIGGLRIYEGGDQVWWKAIPGDHNFPIRSATATVRLPQTFPKNELVVESYGAPVTNISYTDRGAVVFKAQDIPPGQELEVRVQFPHGVVQGNPPAWQAADDRRQRWGPVVGLFSGVLGLALLIGGPVGIYLLWHSRGRDVETPVVAEYISEPPNDLPAAIVGALVDEHAETKDIIAGILDLAQRGAIRMEEQQKDARGGFGVSREFIFYLEDASRAKYPHEQRLLARIFGKDQERRLRDLHQKFYTTIPELQSQLYHEVVEKGFFPRSPESTRQTWTFISIFGLIVSGLASFCLLTLFGDYSMAVACPGLALVTTMIALWAVSRHMPRKTPQGVEEAAKWLAFKNYLQNIEQYADLETVKDKFEQYLPYAMAFGLEKRLIHKFSAVNTPAPHWWGPGLPYPPYYGGYGGPVGRASSGGPAGGPPGPLAGESGGAPSLSSMSETIGTSLANMSDSLGTLLNSASSTLTSTPPQTSAQGGFGGGGFSGGGSFGGGGGGGGSRGFG
jgi:uncharacterized membrane protein YgcG